MQTESRAKQAAAVIPYSVACPESALDRRCTEQREGLCTSVFSLSASGLKGKKCIVGEMLSRADWSKSLGKLSAQRREMNTSTLSLSNVPLTLWIMRERESSRCFAPSSGAVTVSNSTILYLKNTEECEKQVSLVSAGVHTDSALVICQLVTQFLIS